MLGLFIGAFQLFLVVNACIRSIASKWLVGSIGGIVRTFLLMAITMANARIRMAGAEPTAAFTVALFGGPVLSLLLFVLALRRRRTMPAGSEAEAAADRSMKAWLAVAVMDAIFVAIGLVGRLQAAAP